MHLKTEKLWTRDYIYLGMSMFLLTTAFYLLLPTLPVFAVDVLKIDNSQLGLIIAIFTLAALLVRPFAGLGVDLLGRKGILLISTWLFALFFIGYNWAILFIPLLILRFVHGLLWGASTSAYFATVVDIIPVRKRGRGIGYFGLAFNLAMVIGPAIGILIMADDRYGWLFYSTFFISMLGIVFLYLFKFPSVRKPEKQKITFNSLFAKKAFPVSLNVIFVVSAFGAVITFVPIYARANELTEFVAWFFTVLALGMGVSRLFSGYIFDRFGPKYIILVGLLLASGALFVLASIHNPIGFLGSSVCLGLGMGIVVPLFQTIANNVVVKERRGVANSTFLTGLDLGIGLGSIYTGWLADLFSLSISFIISAIMILVGTLVFYLITFPNYQRNRRDD